MALGAWYEAQVPAAEPRIRLTTTARGWELTIDLAGTGAEGLEHDPVERHRGEADWLKAWRSGEFWHGACGPRDIDELVAEFLAWLRVEPEPVVVGPLGAELTARCEGIGLDADAAARYGPERVRWALDSLDAAQGRGGIVAPAAWVEQLLDANWGQPTAIVQRELPFAEAAARAAAPPEGVRWAREKATGLALAVLDVDAVRVQLAGGIAIPAHLWRDWEWLADAPAGQEARAAEAGDPRRADLARMTTWARLRKRLPEEIAEKLASLGLSAEEWEAYRATP